MKTICPSIRNPREPICAETSAGPTSIVVFGASGDLAHRKLYPSLFELFRRDLLDRRFYLIGCGRTGMNDEQFREGIRRALPPAENRSDRAEAFLRACFYVRGDYASETLYENLREAMARLDKTYGMDGVRVFYFSVPPEIYATIGEMMARTNLSCPIASGRMQQVRLVIEKPFGRDLASSVELNQKLHACFDESQIYRIDHYMGKETVQNILIFRFINSLFEPVWNRNYIDHVRVTIAESLGIEHRAGFYDKTGALRDIFQNHMLQIVTLIAMEPPTSFQPDRVRDEKAKLLRSLTPLDEETVRRTFVRARYGPGEVAGRAVPGYRQEEGIDPRSRTETYVAARIGIDNWRWQGVPFYLQTGKRLRRKLTEVVVTFKTVPHSMFRDLGLDGFPPNVLRFQIQPEEGIFLSLQAKMPGSKLCISTLEMAMDYQQIFGVQMPEAYQRLLLDCMIGDSTLFTRRDSVELSWEYLMPVLSAWEQSDVPLYTYPAGASNVDEADRLWPEGQCGWSAI